MKKLLTIAGILASLCSYGQVTLEHDYTTLSGYEVVEIEGEGHKYIAYDKSKPSFELFNSDHTYWRTIKLNIPTGSTMYYRAGCSKLLFDNDQDLEIYCSYMDAATNTVKGLIVNEDGSIMENTGNTGYGIIKRVGNSWKLLAHYNSPNLGTKVYALPGQYLGLRPEPKTLNNTQIYPNPVETAATITYTLPEGRRQAQLNIYNSAGVLVKQMTVTDQFDDVLIFSGDLPSGNYVYEVGGNKAKFSVK